jgi:hypothetical protein
MAWEYEIVVEGELRDAVGTAFAGFRMTRCRGNTVLFGPVRDQAELHGILQRLWGLGVTLIGLNALDRGAGVSSRLTEHEKTFTRIEAHLNPA